MEDLPVPSVESRVAVVQRVPMAMVVREEILQHPVPWVAVEAVPTAEQLLRTRLRPLTDLPGEITGLGPGEVPRASLRPMRPWVHRAAAAAVRVVVVRARGPWAERVSNGMPRTAQAAEAVAPVLAVASRA